jgi:hypothetical protein
LVNDDDLGRRRGLDDHHLGRGRRRSPHNDHNIDASEGRLSEEQRESEHESPP